MKHENNQVPKDWLTRLVPQSLDFLPTLVSPVLPSGKNVGPMFCLIVAYSAERQAIVSDYESTKKQVKLYEGHPSFLELYYRRSFRAIPILAAILLTVIGIIVLFRIS